MCAAPSIEGPKKKRRKQTGKITHTILYREERKKLTMTNKVNTR